MEMKLEVAKGERVIFPQLGWLVDGLAVDQRSVSTLEIFEKEVTVTFEDLRVVPTDSLVVEHDLATGMPSEDGPLTMELEQVPGDVSLLRGEVSQGWDSRWTGRPAAPVNRLRQPSYGRSGQTVNSPRDR